MVKETLNLNRDYIGTVQDNLFNNPKNGSLYHKLFSVIKIQELFDSKPELSEKQKKILQGQIERFVKLMGVNFIAQNQELLSLPVGTLIHSTDFTSEEDKEKLKNISDTGILTGQAVGIPEDGQETYYCADFFKVWKDCKIKDWKLKKCLSGGKLKVNLDVDRGNFSDGDAISFVITPNESIKELCSYDCYRDDNRNGEITKTFVNVASLPLKYSKHQPYQFALSDDSQKGGDLQSNIGSSILFGVPSNFITGIVCGDNVIKDKEKIKYLKEIFPGRMLYDKEGNSVYVDNIIEDKSDFLIKEDINTLESIEKIRNAFSFYKSEILPLILDNPKVTQKKEGYHGLYTHTQNVVFRGICYAVSLGEDPIPVVFACACHDLARINDEYNEEHGKNAIPVTMEIINNKNFNLTEEQKRQVIEAVENHTTGVKATNYVAACLRDADRTRLSRERGYNEKFFNTEQGKKVASQKMFTKGRREFKEFENKCING